MNPSSLRLLACLPLLSLLACSRSDAGPSVDVPTFRDVSQAPAAIQKAARAVVRIETADAYATGSFISATGTLLTNNHVLGVEVCPKEGCFAQITWMHQRGEAPQKPVSIFVVPQAIDVGLDMAVLQAYALDASGQRAAPLSTPDFLTLDPRDPGSLEGTHVNIVGHPEGRLKKWTDGVVVDSAGAWITSTAFTLPGNSGSPILEDDGRIVGILHRGPVSQDLLTSDGADTYSVGTASGALAAAMSAPLPAATLSTAAPTTDDDVVAHQVVFLNARAATATVAGASKAILLSLGAACDKGLARTDYASPDDLTLALAPCDAAERWIDCRADSGAAFAVCPTPDAIATWQGRFQGEYDHWKALIGQHDLGYVTFAMARLEATQTAGQTAAQNRLQQVLAADRPTLDFGTVVYLAAFGITSYDGASLPDFVRNFAQQRYYPFEVPTILEAALFLNQAQQMSGDDVKSLMAKLAGDAKVDLGGKLFVEEVQYNSGLL